MEWAWYDPDLYRMLFLAKTGINIEEVFDWVFVAFCLVAFAVAIFEQPGKR